MKNRLCIYLTYDKEKIVDNYIGCMLKELKTCVANLTVVCNETEVVGGIENLEKYADQIYYRENIGFDAGGFKDALCDFIGWDRVWQYDELVLVNDSMFGPFEPMKDIFRKMDDKKLDFWGLAKAEYGACKNNFGLDVPEHIQSYFIVVRSQMLHCRQFREYWEEMPYYAAFDELYREYEFKFTQYFAGLGYRYGALADTEVNDSKNIANNYCQYAAIPYELIKKRNFPFLKKQQIAFDILDQQTQEQIRLAIDYIDKNTEYDVNLIWDNIIRTLNVTDLQRNLCFQYIIPSANERIVCQKKVMIVIFAEYIEAVEFVLEYLDRLPSTYVKKVFTENNDVLNRYQKNGMICKKTCIGTIEALSGELKDSEFVCILHDTDVTSEERPSCTGKSYFYHTWENLLKDSSHVQGIIERFMNEPRLGFLAPPQPVFADYFGDLGKGWGEKFNKIQRIVEELELKCQLSELNPPFSMPNSLWIRSCLLNKLNRMKSEDYQYLPYLWISLAQDAGYFAGVVESSEYASMNEINLQYYLNQITKQVRRQYGDFRNFFEMRKLIFQGALTDFCGKHSRLLVYGTGYMARKYKNILPNVEAYVISDGREKQEELDGIPVRYLSEIAKGKDCGIVLCLDERHQMQVVPLLREYGITEYICV